MAKRTAAGTLALAVCLSGGALALAGAAQADSTVTFTAPLKGATRLDTSVAMSQAAFAKGASDAVIVNEYATVDGLTASYLAGLHHAPILYTDIDSMPSQTSAELTRLGVKNLWFVGGNARISDKQVDFWKAQGLNTTRVGGADRYGTAAAIAEDTSGKPKGAFVATGAKQADALALGPVAFSANMPILLADPNHVDAAQGALKALSISKPIAVGGTVALSTATAAAVGADETQRIAGVDRGETAAKIAGWAIGNAGFTNQTVGLVPAADQGFVDALAASPLAGVKKEPILFAGLPTTNAYLAQPQVAGPLSGPSDVFGNVPPDAVASAQAAVQSGPAINAYTVTALGKNVVTVSSGGASSDNAGLVQYTATGLGSGKVNVRLVPAANVVTDGNGMTWVKVTSTSSKVASPTNATNAKISVINGAGYGSAEVDGISPNNGVINFALNSTISDKVVPVIFSDADDNTDLSVDNGSIKSMTVDGTTGYYAMVKESFGAGPKTTWNPADASTGVFNGYTVDSVDTAAKTIAAHSGGSYATFHYGVPGSTYVYGAGGSTLNPDQFGNILGSGDVIKVNYNSSGPSTFTVTTDVPAAPTNVKAVYGETYNNSNGAVKITWSPSASNDADSYTITRYSVTNGVVSTSGTTITQGWAGYTSPTSSTSNGVTTWTAYDTGATSSGTYVYAVSATNTSTTVNGGTLTAGGTGSNSTQSLPVVVPSGAVAGSVAGAPYISSTTLSDANSNFTADTGDVFQILFDEPTTGADQANTAYRINDGTSAATVTVGTNATARYADAGTYTINGKSVTVKDGQLVLVRLIDKPGNFTTTSSNTTITTNAVVSYPATITQITSNVIDKDESNTVTLSKGATSLSTAGSGTLASAQSAWTGSAPEAPSNLSTTSTTTTSLTATIGTTGARTAGWTYKLYDSSANLVATWATGDSTATSHIFTGLTHLGSYTVKVTAENTSGSSTVAQVAGSVS